jgi:hypothetical protein
MAVDIIVRARVVNVGGRLASMHVGRPMGLMKTSIDLGEILAALPPPQTMFLCLLVIRDYDVFFTVVGVLRSCILFCGGVCAVTRLVAASTCLRGRHQHESALGVELRNF